MSPENECPRFKQNTWKKDLCSNCFRPKEEHPQKPKRVHIDYKPLPEISPDLSILKGKSACEKSLNVSFSNVEYEVIGYGGEEYSTDEDYSSDDEDVLEYPDSAEEEELKRLTEANTNMNGKLNIVPEKNITNPQVTKITSVKAESPKSNGLKITEKSLSPPLVTVKPFGGDPEPKSLVYSFLKNKEIAAAAKKETPVKTTSVVLANVEEKSIISEETPIVNCTKNEVPIRKTENKKTSLVRSSLVASSNESYLNVKRSNFLVSEDTKLIQVLDKPAKKETLEVISSVSKLPQPEEIKTERLKGNEPTATTDTPLTPPKEPELPAIDISNIASYKMRSNVPRMGTAQFKIKMPVAVVPFQKSDSCKTIESPESLTSRELAGEPDGKADSDEPNEQQPSLPVTPTNRSFLHSFSKDKSPPPPPPCDTPPRTPLRKSSSCSPPECPRSIKRQAPKPPSTPPSPMIVCANNNSYLCRQESNVSVSDDESGGLDENISTNHKLLAEYCEQIENEKYLPNNNENIPIVESVETSTRESATLPLPVRRVSFEKKKYGKAARVGSKIKKFLRIPSKESVNTLPQTPSRPKLEIIHPLDINKSGVEIIHNIDLIHHIDEKKMKDLTTKMSSQHHPTRPSKPPPPPRSHPPTPQTTAVKNNLKLTEYCDDASKTCDSSTSDEIYEQINYSAPECDHSSEMAQLTSMQYCGSETESEIYPVIQFGDDFGIEDSVRNIQTKNHKSLEKSYDAVVIANHEALSKLLDQASGGPKIPKELMVFQTKSLEWSSFRIDSTSRLQKGEYSFYNSKWYDVPVVLSISTKEVKLKNVLNNHFTLTKISQFIGQIGKEFSISNENEEAYITLWNAHCIESIESYCKDYNAKYSDVNKEAGLILVETVNLLMGLQASNVEKYTLQPFVISRNLFGTDPTIAIIQVENVSKEEDTLCNIMLNILKLLAPTWEMTICLSQVLRQGKANSLSKCKALLEFWLWGPTGVTVAPDRPLSLKRWLDLERANNLHNHVCAHFTNLTVQQICYLSFLVANNEMLLTEVWTIIAGLKIQPLGNNF
ncbi:uncharacterized protein LOC126906693 [Daktulosphaira vitifoliae]|uniref:uncharacterized protein LOC126906693 n=1 Tax=Daktulosphaira vitifoliae TaxID=58002 RepID=UPI0021A9E08A|nr:uncharacterized protein LOC126906693 [Daktulosphaira vitifoliae]XP_050543395.1 uncharacterized protein LOC126906693 [Daktulosphaira vitifoliae]XP_050543396.1 uncharacterized protein LOC126906693 [Daktulosphaira vitifoliae]